jgi:NADH-quinone oxidoreductase subunit E
MRVGVVGYVLDTGELFTSVAPRSMPFALSQDREQKLSELLPKYPTKVAALLPLLHLCQDQKGYVDDEVILFAAHRLDVPPAHVKGVVTFYTLYNQHPVGKHQVWVCKTLPCALRGSGAILAHCQKKLGIHAGETTKDGQFTLRTAECLASCGTAPRMQIDKAYYENLTLQRVDQILESLGAAK